MEILKLESIITKLKKKKNSLEGPNRRFELAKIKKKSENLMIDQQRLSNLKKRKRMEKIQWSLGNSWDTIGLANTHMGIPAGDEGKQQK